MDSEKIKKRMQEVKFDFVKKECEKPGAVEAFEKGKTVRDHIKFMACLSISSVERHLRNINEKEKDIERREKIIEKIKERIKPDIEKIKKSNDLTKKEIKKIEGWTMPELEDIGRAELTFRLEKEKEK